MMVRQAITQKPFIIFLLLIQVIPLVIFPPSTYVLTNQEWWLPVLLTLMALVADFEIIVRRRDIMWPWYLVSFSQGFNIISRLMMLMPHSTFNLNGAQVFNAPYVTITMISMLISAFLLWYVELPDVRMAMLRD